MAPPGAAPASRGAGSRPNIVFFLAEDLSYGDLSCLGQQQFQTPHLDRLCQQGLRFDEAYAGAPECAPARASLMTGLHLGHCTVRNNESARGQDHLRAADVTVAQRLQAAGYATAMVGKWGIALPGTEGVPCRKRFDYSFGFYDQKRAHTYCPHYLFQNETPAANPENCGFDLPRTYRHTHEAQGLHPYDAEGRLLPDAVADPLAAERPALVDQVLSIFREAHVDSEWYLKPGETREQFEAKRRRAREEGALLESVTGNTQYLGRPAR